MAGAAMAVLAAYGAYTGYLDNKNQQNQLALQQKNLHAQEKITKELGVFEFGIFMRRAEFLRGAIPAAAAGAGVRADSGSAFEVLMEQARNDASEGLQIQQARTLQAYGLGQQRQQAKFQQKVTKRQLPLDIIGGAMQGASAGANT